MVKTLVIETNLADITVHEPAGFGGDNDTSLQLAVIRHITGVDALPLTSDGISELISNDGWWAVIRYVKIVKQTSCIQWKKEPLFRLPSPYAAHPMICAGFDAVMMVPTDFLTAWYKGIEQVSETVAEAQTKGKTEGES